MASSINVNQNNNIVSLQDQNRKITITDNVQEKTVNITQPITNIVSVNSLGPQGIEGVKGPSGSQGIQGNAGPPSSFFSDIEVRNITSSGNISASVNLLGGDITINGNTSTFNTNRINLGFDNNDRINANAYFATRIHTISHITASGNISSSGGTITALNYQNNGTVADTDLTGSFTGSFVGNGSGLTDLPQNRSFGLSITSSGDISASGGIYGDVYYSDNIRVLASTTTGGSYLGSVTNKTEIDGTAITLDAHVTASGNISASGTITGDGYPFHQSPFLFTLQTSSTTGTTIFSESIAGFTPTGTIGGGTIGVIYFSSQSANGIRMTGNNPITIPSIAPNYFNDVGSQITLTSTSSGKFIRVKTTSIVSNANQFQFTYQDALVITGSTGFPDSGDVVEMSWDNSAGVGTIQGSGITNADTTINKINIAYRTSSGIYAPNIDPSLGDESPVSAAAAIYAIPFISKSADLTLNSLTTVGNISSSAGTGSFGRMILPNLPTADPGVAGMLFTTQSAGTGGNLDGQKILLVSEG